MESLPPEAPRHPIAVVANRTGLTPDVLRVWERRYGAVTPERTASGERLYSDADVERLRLLHAAVRSGRRIGQVARASTEELARLEEQNVSARPPAMDGADADQAAVTIEQALEHTAALDGRLLDASLRRAAHLLGLPAFLETVAAPLLREVGERWHAGRLTVAQEHLASATVHDIVAAAMRRLTPPHDAERIVVGTTSGERHATGALLAGAAAAAAGWNVLYLGADVPAEELADAAHRAQARFVAVSMVFVEDAARVLEQLRTLQVKLAGAAEVIVGGPGAERLTDSLGDMGVRIIPSVGELGRLLSSPGEVAVATRGRPAGTTTRL